MKKRNKCLIGALAVLVIGLLWAKSYWDYTFVVRFPEDAEVWMLRDGGEPRQLAPEDGERVIALFNAYPTWQPWNDCDCYFSSRVFIGQAQIWMSGGHCRYTYRKDGEEVTVDLKLKEEDAETMAALFVQYCGEW